MALPKKAKGSLLLLAAPFEPPVWILTIVSIFFVVIALRLIFRGRKLHNDPRHLQLVLRMVLDQSLPFTAEYIIMMKVKLLFTAWFFSVMVLSVGYKCKLVSHMITPIMGSQPKTFPELAKSHYAVGAISYMHGLLRDMLQERTAGDPVLQLLATKIQPYAYRDQNVGPYTTGCGSIRHKF